MPDAQQVLGVLPGGVDPGVEECLCLIGHQVSGRWELVSEVSAGLHKATQHLGHGHLILPAGD